MSYSPPIFIHRLADVESGAIIGNGTKIWRWTHIREGAAIGENCSIGQGCYVSPTAVIGNNVRIQNGVYIWDGVVIEDDCFIGPNVCFTNVKRPRSYKRGRFERTLIKKGATIGANATIICGVELGEGCFIGAGSVVTKSVPSNVTAWGVPCKVQSYQWLKREFTNDAKHMRDEIYKE